MNPIHKKVRFKGELYWLHETRISGEYNLSPLEHYDEDGKLTLPNPFIDISYAVVEGDTIYRWHQKIGSITDLEDV
jgi:hypothetical protein